MKTSSYLEKPDPQIYIMHTAHISDLNNRNNTLRSANGLQNERKEKKYNSVKRFVRKQIIEQRKRCRLKKAGKKEQIISIYVTLLTRIQNWNNWLQE